MSGLDSYDDWLDKRPETRPPECRWCELRPVQWVPEIGWLCLRCVDEVRREREANDDNA